METIKGYKVFGKGMIENGKQYAENKVFEDSEKTITFCTDIIDTIGFYKILDTSEFAEVEAIGEYEIKGSLVYTNKLKVNRKITRDEFIEIASSGSYPRLISSGDFSNLACPNDYSILASLGGASNLASSGNYSKLVSSGDFPSLASSGDCSVLISPGDNSMLTSSGDNSMLTSTGYHSIVAGIGLDCKARARKGSWIVLAEWVTDEEIYYEDIPKCVKAEYVDGSRIKGDTWYTLKNGEFVECEN